MDSFFLNLLSHFLLLPEVPLLEFHSLAWSYHEATIWVLMTLTACLLCVRTRVHVISELIFDQSVIVCKVLFEDLF